MASVVDICNLALGHLGDRATVSSIDPPEGSPQAEHCARFYPLARDVLLKKHQWNWATVRGELAELPNVGTQWRYTYAVPANMLEAISVLRSDASNDYDEQLRVAYVPERVINFGITVYSPQPFALERSGGVQVIRTNTENALLRYTTSDLDPTQFDALFVEALSYMLAAYLAGPIIKGDVGSQVAQRMRQVAEALLMDAKANDADEGLKNPGHSVPWIVGR